MMHDLENALKYFAEICDEKNVPVGISVLTSGRFLVNYSLNEAPVMCDNLETAAKFIISHMFLTMAEPR